MKADEDEGMAVGKGGEHPVVQYRLLASLTFPVCDEGLILLLVVEEEIRQSPLGVGGWRGQHRQVFLTKSAMILHQRAELGGGFRGKTEDHNAPRWGIQAVDEACGGMFPLKMCQEILLPRGIGLGGDARRLADEEEITVFV
jgi:hypothetical protein